MDDAKDLREYEIGFLSRDEAAAKDMAEKAGRYGTVTAQGLMKRLSFAYPVKKEISGFFGFLRLEAGAQAISQLEKDLEITPMILRFLVVRLEKKRKEREAQAAASPRRIPRAAPRPEVAQEGALTNEALEKKIEEILQ